MRLLALLVLGCVSQPPSDEQRYLEALRAPVEEAERACRQVRATSAQGECLTAVAVRRAGEGEAAVGLCATIPHETWRWECALRVVEAAPLLGEAAQRACAGAGRFERVCQFHALQAAVVAIGWSDERLGEEAAALQRIVELVEAHRAWPVHGEVLRPEPEQWSVQRHARSLLHQRLVERLARRPFELRLCGTAPEELCAAAVRAAVLAQVQAERLAVVCGQEPLRNAVIEAGGMGWTTVSEPAARAALGPLCAGLAAGERRPEALIGLDGGG